LPSFDAQLVISISIGLACDAALLGLALAALAAAPSR